MVDRNTGVSKMRELHKIYFQKDLKHHIEAGIRQHHARHTTDGEQEDEADGPEHRDAEGDRATPHCRDPGA